jgi:HAD superfamily hydrolase (TIGR01509 family)
MRNTSGQQRGSSFHEYGRRYCQVRNLIAMARRVNQGVRLAALGDGTLAARLGECYNSIMPQPSAILFDNDGILAHTEQFWFEANRQVFADLSIPYTRGDFIEHTFIESWGSSGWMRRNGHAQELIAEFTRRRNELWKQMIAGTDVTEPTAVDTLSELATQYRLGVVTNTNVEMFGLLHKDPRFRNLFDMLILREHYDKGKPAPDAYEAALAHLNLPADEALVVEDSPRGIASAHAAGIRVVAIPNPAFPDLNVAEADYHVSSLPKLADLIKEL